MKKMNATKTLLLTALLTVLLVMQPTTIVYYAKEEERQFWELVNTQVIQEGTFTEEPQEVVFVYRKRTAALPFQMIQTKTSIPIIPPDRKQSSHYGELLSNVSGIFLFGSARS